MAYWHDVRRLHEAIAFGDREEAMNEFRQLFGADWFDLPRMRRLHPDKVPPLPNENTNPKAN